MATRPTTPEVTGVERSGENGRARGAEAIGDCLVLGAMAGYPDGSLCSDAQSVVTSTHGYTYRLGARYGRRSRAALPRWNTTRQRRRDEEDECLLKPSRRSARLTS